MIVAPRKGTSPLPAPLPQSPVGPNRLRNPALQRGATLHRGSRVMLLRRFYPESSSDSRSVPVGPETNPESDDVKRSEWRRRGAHPAVVPGWPAILDQPWLPTAPHPFLLPPEPSASAGY